ncbi:MAG: hypothetical protein WD844_05390 [Thermoleophilaceae bacterium]
MSTLAIVLIVIGVVLALLLLGGAIAARRRTGGDYAEHVAQADHALEAARAADRGWDRDVLERTARAALDQARPGWGYDELHLVLVDDRPGVVDDRAHLVAMGDGSEARLVLTREAGGEWVVEGVE